MPKKQASVSLVGVPRELTGDDVEAIFEMARERAALVGNMRRALEAGDDQRALELARQVAGIGKEMANQ